MTKERRLMDYHLHTTRCHHAEGNMVEYVESAIRQGIDSIGFADHAPTKDQFDPKHRMNWHEFAVYVREIEALREQFSDIQILIGIEADLYPGFQESIQALKNQFPIDYVIGSVHYVANQLLFHCPENEGDEAGNKLHLHEYVHLLKMGIHSGLINVIGHLDLIKYLFPNDISIVHEALAPLFPLMAQHALIVELNTSGFRKRPKQAFPDPMILKSLCQQKVRVCLGSDAHQPDQVGLYFNEAIALLHHAGYCSDSIKSSKFHTFLPG